MLDDIDESVHACDEDVVTKRFTCLGCVVHNNGESYQEVTRRSGLTHGAMDSPNKSIRSCRYLCRWAKI